MKSRRQCGCWVSQTCRSSIRAWSTLSISTTWSPQRPIIRTRNGPVPRNCEICRAYLRHFAPLFGGKFRGRAWGSTQVFSGGLGIFLKWGYYFSSRRGILGGVVDRDIYIINDSFPPPHSALQAQPFHINTYRPIYPTPPPLFFFPDIDPPDPTPFPTQKPHSQIPNPSSPPSAGNIEW